MAKTTRKSAMPGNVTKKQVAKVEKRKSYNQKVASYNKSVDNNEGSIHGGIQDGLHMGGYAKYRKPKAVIQADSGKSKVVKQSFRSEDLKNKKAVGKQNKKYSKTIYK